jgi:alpha-1,6-mannosyltransferase
VLLEAARLLGNTYHLLLVGPGMPRQLPENVTVIERACSPLEVARLMASSDVLLHAGDQEAFGLVVLEAMACGLPVVAARAGALPELVPFHCGRLCRPRDARAMAQTVRELFYGDPRQLGLQARLHVEAHYAWDAVILGLLSHYHAVLGSADVSVAVHG